MPAESNLPFVIQDLPLDAPPERLPELINQRFRRLAEGLGLFVQQDSPADVDFGSNRGVSLADPKDDTDAVNLRTLKRIATPNKPVQDASTPKADPQHYGIVLQKDAAVNDGDESPYYPIGEGRQGVPDSIVLAAKTAPTFGQLKVNFKVQKPGDTTASDLLDLPLALDIGATGPQFATTLQIRDTMPKGTLIYMVIVEGGGAERVTGVLIVKRTL